MLKEIFECDNCCNWDQNSIKGILDNGTFVDKGKSEYHLCKECLEIINISEWMEFKTLTVAEKEAYYLLKQWLSNGKSHRKRTR